MNMILHDIHYRKFDIKQEDTLENPQHMDMRFEAIVANPPFSANWSANPLFTSDENKVCRNRYLKFLETKHEGVLRNGQPAIR